MREYDQIADWFAGSRSREAGVPDILALADRLGPGGSVLDLGCGTGVPLARALIERGFRVYGIDSSPEMVARLRLACPEAFAECEPIQRSTFFGRTFDAAIAWGVMFHLAAEDQALAIRKVAGALDAAGLFLFTAGEREGTSKGRMHDVRFSYRSLGSRAYRRLLQASGLDLLDEHADAWDNYVFLARKRVGDAWPSRSDGS